MVYYILKVMHFRDEKEDVTKIASLAEPENTNLEVDEDGFCIQPKTTQVWTNDKNSFYSSSDSDSGNITNTSDE